MTKMFNNKRLFHRFFITVICILSLIRTSALAQHSIVTLSCDSGYIHCDTLTIEHFDDQKKLISKVRIGNPTMIVYYKYNQQGKLIHKNHQNISGEFQKENNITLDSTGTWTVDSLTGKKGETLAVFKRTPLSKPYRYQIEWFFKGDSKPSTRQIIQEDELGNELSNSTCYNSDNCVTYKNYYNGNRKMRTELWVLESTSNTPVLRESEDYYYQDGDDPIGSVRFKEPEHEFTGRFKYIRTEP